jgi:hypothetical protein
MLTNGKNHIFFVGIYIEGNIEGDELKKSQQLKKTGVVALLLLK